MSYLDQRVLPHVKSFLPEAIVELFEDSLRLQARGLVENISDASYIFFPAAKAYEGFLKFYFFKNNLIDEKTYHGKHFRIGRSFNPDIDQNKRDEIWLYDDVAASCGEEIAREMWNLWLDGRNQLMHFFPDERHVRTVEEVNLLLNRLFSILNQLCKV